jgi:uncharacterized protein (UPF0276 family)
MNDPIPGAAPAPACGLNLHRQHYEAILAQPPPLPFLEAISENFMVEGGRPRHVLRKVREHHDVALHGVSMSLGSAEPLDQEYVRRLSLLVREVEPVVVSDHLCWTRLAGHSSHDLLPLPFTEEAVRTTAAKIRQAQDVLGRRLLVENVSTYVRFARADMTEAEFVVAVLEEADCGLLLDVNNVYVNARNHGFDPEAYLASLPAARVGQYHLAGHEDHGDHVLDTHDHPVVDAVWALLARAVALIGPRPTILERDDHVPPLPELLAECARAQEILDVVLAA